MQMYHNQYGTVPSSTSSSSPLLSSFAATNTAAAVAVACVEQLLNRQQQNQEQQQQSLLLYNQLLQQQREHQERNNAVGTCKASLQESNDTSTISPMMMKMKMLFNNSKKDRLYPSSSGNVLSNTMLNVNIKHHTPSMLQQQLRLEQQERQGEEQQQIQNLLTKLRQNNQQLHDHQHAQVMDVMQQQNEQEIRQRRGHDDGVTIAELFDRRKEQLNLQMINHVVRHHELNQAQRCNHTSSDTITTTRNKNQNQHHSIGTTTSASASTTGADVTNTAPYQELLHRKYQHMNSTLYNNSMSPQQYLLNHQNKLLYMQQQHPNHYHSQSLSSSTIQDILQRMNSSVLSTSTYHPNHDCATTIPQVPSILSNHHHNMMDLFSTYQPITGSLSSSLSSIPLSLPVLIVRPFEDRFKLSDQQFLLRQQIEVFEAGHDDVTTHTRGRNKPISYGQVGIRCKHCAHVPVSKRQKGSTYFPSNILGIYQAAQNMCATHIQCGICEYMPQSIKQQFEQLMSHRSSTANGETEGIGIRYSKNNHTTTGSGRPYWAKGAQQLGLIDTEFDGIRFICSRIQHKTTTSIPQNF
jgi:hypothetical protein